MRKWLLHIGLPKTATTTLQRNVFSVLDVNFIGKPYKDISELQEEYHHGKLSDFVNSLATKPGWNIISDESMCSLGYKGIIALLNALSVLPNREILLTLRDPLSLQISAYKYWLKSVRRYGGYRDFYEFCQDGWNLPLDYYRLVNLTTLYAKTHVLYYEDMPTVFAKQLGEILGMNIDEKLFDSVSNKSMTDMQMNRIGLFSRWKVPRKLWGLWRDTYGH